MGPGFESRCHPQFFFKVLYELVLEELLVDWLAASCSSKIGELQIPKSSSKTAGGSLVKKRKYREDW